MNNKNISENYNNISCNKAGLIYLSKSKLPRIVIIGGGFAGLSLIESLKNANVQVVLIDKNNYHQFQPLLYQVATSGLEPDNVAFPFRKQISKYKNVTFRLAEVEEVNTELKTIYTDKGMLQYDYLVLATGTTTNFFEMKNVEKNSLGMKSILDSLNIRHMMLQNLEQATITCNKTERDTLTNFVIVGGGPAGVEMAGALAEFKKYILPKDYPEYPPSIMNIYLIEGSDRLISAMSEKASVKTLYYLKELNVKVLFNEIVTDYNGEVIITKSGKEILAKNLIWTAGVKGQLPKGIDEKHIVAGNRLKTDQYLQVEKINNVFATGDVAAVISKETPKGHPQVAQAAIQQGKIAAVNIVNRLNNKKLIPFNYKDKGSLATVGKRRAVADLGKLKFGGYIAWLLWSFVHLMSISGFRNKLLVGINWAVSYFSYEKSNRIIIRKYKEN
ncbi:MAG: NAD(P)/FAD-dependent oxidoreductase [Bacteroidales bacterium]|nr:NAD(P)/FAD-dependent oxidoreductase [Bacteroidales bacterium]